MEKRNRTRIISLSLIITFTSFCSLISGYFDDYDFADTKDISLIQSLSFRHSDIEHENFQPQTDPNHNSDSRFFISLYGGRYTDRHLASKVLMLKPIHYEDSWIQVLTIGGTFYEKMPFYALEIEFQWGKHIGKQSHNEFNLAGVFRWHYLPHILGQPLSLALGTGESYATKTPPIEDRSRTNVNASQWLNYLLIEGMISVNNSQRWHMFGRIHHRSGIFGLYNGVRGGSNLMTLGIRYDL